MKMPDSIHSLNIRRSARLPRQQLTVVTIVLLAMMLSLVYLRPHLDLDYSVQETTTKNSNHQNIIFPSQLGTSFTSYYRSLYKYRAPKPRATHQQAITEN